MFGHGVRRRPVLNDREHNGYIYSVNKIEGETLYLRCKERSLKNCRVTAQIVAGQFIVEGRHSHPIDNRLLKKKKFNDALYAAVTSSLRSFRVIYDELCGRDPSGAAEVPFQSVAPAMQRWRRIICPPAPRTLAHYADLLALEQWHCFRTYEGGQLNVTAVRCRDGSCSVIYCDLEFLRGIRTTRIYVDTTFKVCPRKPKVLQFLTIMAQIDDTSMPIAWALMERKTYAAYESVLQHFSTVLAPHIRPASFMTDFERSLANALQTIYPEATAQRCYFHYCQALMKRAKREGILHRIRNCEDMGIVFRKLMALPLLPAIDIVAAFRWIVEHTPLEIAMYFTGLFEYIDSYWLKIVGPQIFTVFGVKCKTNNLIESYHRVLKIRMGVHSAIWQFTENLCRLQAVVHSSMISLESGLAINRPPAERQIIQHNILRRAWDFYLRGLLDIPRFLACASSFLRAFNRGNLMLEENMVNHFVNPVVNDVTESRIQILLEERLDDIYVLRRPLESGGEEIIILPGLRFRVCALCGIRPTETVGLPCCHWIGCIAYTANLMLLARSKNADIRCSLCALVMRTFRKVTIE